MQIAHLKWFCGFHCRNEDVGVKEIHESPPDDNGAELLEDIQAEEDNAVIVASPSVQETESGEDLTGTIRELSELAQSPVVTWNLGEQDQVKDQGDLDLDEILRLEREREATRKAVTTEVDDTVDEQSGQLSACMSAGGAGRREFGRGC